MAREYLRGHKLSPRKRWKEKLKCLGSGVFRKKAAAAKLLQSCPTLCDPTDGSPPGSSVPGILQARILEWVAISFSNAWKLKVKVKSLSRVRLFETPWIAAYQAPPSMGFSRQEYWGGLPLPSPRKKATCPHMKGAPWWKWFKVWEWISYKVENSLGRPIWLSDASGHNQVTGFSESLGASLVCLRTMITKCPVSFESCFAVWPSTLSLLTMMCSHRTHPASQHCWRERFSRGLSVQGQRPVS